VNFTELHLLTIATYVAQLTVALSTPPSLASHIEDVKGNAIYLYHDTDTDGQMTGHVMIDVTLKGLSDEPEEFKNILAGIGATVGDWEFNDDEGDILTFSAENQALVYRGER